MLHVSVFLEAPEQKRGLILLVVLLRNILRVVSLRNILLVVSLLFILWVAILLYILLVVWLLKILQVVCSMITENIVPNLVEVPEQKRESLYPKQQCRGNLIKTSLISKLHFQPYKNIDPIDYLTDIQKPFFITRNPWQNLQNDQLKIRTKFHNIPNFSHIPNHFRRYFRNTKHPSPYRFPDPTSKYDPRGFRRGM